MGVARNYKEYSKCCPLVTKDLSQEFFWLTVSRHQPSTFEHILLKTECPPISF